MPVVRRLGRGIRIFITPLSLVIRIRIQCLVRHDAILEQRLQVLLPVVGEQKGVCARPQAGECPIGRREEGPPEESEFVEVVCQSGGLQAQGEGAEGVGEELDDLCRGRRRDENEIDGVDEAVLGGDVFEDDLGKEVDAGAEDEAGAHAQTLGVVAKGGGG